MEALTLQLLTFIAERPRTYGEVMEAWHTTCPRMPVWEDAISDGLVRLEGHGTMRERSVCLTPLGSARLNEPSRNIDMRKAKQHDGSVPSPLVGEG
jgi:hypothetical protein